MVLVMIIVNPRKLEHGFRRIRAGIPYTLPSGQEENDVPTFWLLLYGHEFYMIRILITMLITYYAHSVH